MKRAKIFLLTILLFSMTLPAFAMARADIAQSCEHHFTSQWAYAWRKYSPYNPEHHNVLAIRINICDLCDACEVVSTHNGNEAHQWAGGVCERCGEQSLSAAVDGQSPAVEAPAIDPIRIEDLGCAGMPVIYNILGGNYYHTSYACDLLNEKNLSALRAFTLEEAETLLNVIKPCHECFGASLALKADGNIEEALPYLVGHVKSIIEGTGKWEIRCLKISVLENVLSIQVAINDGAPKEILMAMAKDGWFPVGEVEGR